MRNLIGLIVAVALVPALQAQSQNQNMVGTLVTFGRFKAVVEPGRRFTITNGRNGFSRTYTARP